MRFALLLLIFLVPMAMASADDGYQSMYGGAWSKDTSYGWHISSYYSPYNWWPYYPAVPAKYEVEAAKARLSYSKYSPYSAWWQVQATKERLSTLRYANDYYFGYYDVPAFRGTLWDDKFYRYRSDDEDHWGRDDDHRERRWDDDDRRRGWNDDSAEDVHIPLAEEIKMDLERSGIVVRSEY